MDNIRVETGAILDTKKIHERHLALSNNKHFSSFVIIFLSGSDTYNNPKFTNYSYYINYSYYYTKKQKLSDKNA